MTGYYHATRAPRYSVLFALPLLVLYEVLAATLAQPGQGELRNAADVILRAAFTTAAGPYGQTVFMGAVIGLGAWLVVRDMRATRDRLRPGYFAAMFAESTFLGLIFGFVIGMLTIRLLGPLQALALSPIAGEPWATRLMLSLGAGLYEELFFRVLLVTALVLVGQRVLKLSAGWSIGMAVVASALIFSAFHYIGPYGDALELQSFTFRALAGLAFSGLYVTRGFGITAWTHALYDVYVLRVLASG